MSKLEFSSRKNFLLNQKLRRWRLLPLILKSASIPEFHSNGVKLTIKPMSKIFLNEIRQYLRENKYLATFWQGMLVNMWIFRSSTTNVFLLSRALKVTCTTVIVVVIGSHWSLSACHARCATNVNERHHYIVAELNLRAMTGVRQWC